MVRTHTVCLDTHAVVWIVGGQTEKIGKEALALIAQAELLLSPAVTLELQFLYEVGRVNAPAADAMRTLQRALNVRVASDTFDGVASAALAESWTRDPFDRLIVAHAAVLSAHLVTRDATIHQHFRRAIW